MFLHFVYISILECLFKEKCRVYSHLHLYIYMYIPLYTFYLKVYSNKCHVYIFKRGITHLLFLFFFLGEGGVLKALALFYFF